MEQTEYICVMGSICGVSGILLTLLLTIGYLFYMNVA